MADPTLKRSTVTIGYTASDGYKSQVNYSTRGRMGLEPPPELPLLEAVEELSRLCSLFGFGEPAKARFDGARERVDAWRAARTDGQTASFGSRHAYEATIAMLQHHAKPSKEITQEDILEVACMDVNELRRRHLVQRDWHRLFAKCLDGLPELQALGGSPDGCWLPRDIRKVVEALIAKQKEGAAS